MLGNTSFGSVRYDNLSGALSRDNALDISGLEWLPGLPRFEHTYLPQYLLKWSK